MEFAYFTFRPLMLSEFHAQYPQFTDADASEIFDYWQLDYQFNAIRFYLAQYRQHEDLLRDKFRRLQDYEDNEDIYESPIEKWEKFIESSSLPKHDRMQRQEISLAESTIANINAIRMKDNGTSGSSFSQLAHMKQREMELSGPPDRDIYGLWFNTSIQNPHGVQKALRSIPYAEYLMSPHWKKVRAAMLLSYRAVCQAEDCWYTGESFYGGNWETEIHVHHLSYKNRGNERYDDLTLLCRRHHELWHAHERDQSLPAVKLALRDESSMNRKR